MTSDIADLVARLTTAQRGMLTECLETGAAWVTASGCANHDLLRGWADKGWAAEVDPPMGVKFLAAYQITDAGRAALSERSP